MHRTSLFLRSIFSLLSQFLLCRHWPAADAFSSSLKMVEGHSVHRIASRFRTKLVGKTFTASSPNGRFTAGSEAINNCRLSRTEALGKNLFAFFSPPDDNKEPVVVHVHFGMAGAWSVFDHTQEPEIKTTTRLRLEEVAPSSTSKVVAHLSAMTVQHGDMSLYTTKKAALGQDPLRLDADPDALYAKVSKSKKSIGALIMDQSYFAGTGNIYRCEILFLAGIYPTTPGSSLDRASFDKIWDVSVKLLRRGYDTGSILTVDADLDPILAARGERRYIYNKSRCPRCGGVVRSWDISGRTCYSCEGTCQPKLKAAASAATSAPFTPAKAKKKAAKKATPIKEENEQQHVPFISHCAPDNYEKRLAQHGPQGLTIAEIRTCLEEMVGPDALPAKSARKAVHVDALSAALAKNSVKEEVATPLPPPIISAEDAAREKAAAGENRAVEHIAELSREQAVEAIAAVTPSPSGVKKVGSKKRAAATGGERTSPRTRTTKSRRRLSYD